MLIDHSLAEMQRRGCNEYCISTNRWALGRFARAIEIDAYLVMLPEVREEFLEEYVSNMQRRTAKLKDHPAREQEARRLTAFAIRKEFASSIASGTGATKRDATIHSAA